MGILDKAAALVVSRNLSGSASFSAAFGAQGNLAITPILLFGTAEQKNKYLPKLIAGDLLAHDVREHVEALAAARAVRSVPTRSANRDRARTRSERARAP